MIITLKKQVSKVAYNGPKPFFPAQTTAHSPKLIFHIINMSQDASVSLSVAAAQGPNCFFVNLSWKTLVLIGDITISIYPAEH